MERELECARRTLAMAKRTLDGPGDKKWSIWDFGDELTVHEGPELTDKVVAKVPTEVARRMDDGHRRQHMVIKSTKPLRGSWGLYDSFKLRKSLLGIRIWAWSGRSILFLFLWSSNHALRQRPRRSRTPPSRGQQPGATG